MKPESKEFLKNLLMESGQVVLKKVHKECGLKELKNTPILLKQMLWATQQPY